MTEHRFFQFCFALRRSVAAAAVLLLSINTPQATADGFGRFTPACAERDLQAIAAIEDFTDIDEMPAAWLAEAGLAQLRARLLCLAGEESQGIALYDRIIAGDARLAGLLSANSQGR